MILRISDRRFQKFNTKQPLCSLDFFFKFALLPFGRNSNQLFRFPWESQINPRKYLKKNHGGFKQF